MNGEHSNAPAPLATDRRYKVKAEIRYDVDVGIFTADSLDEAKELAQESLRYSQVANGHRGGVYDLEARQVEEGHASLCGCGWCK